MTTPDPLAARPPGSTTDDTSTTPVDLPPPPPAPAPPAMQGGYGWSPDAPPPDAMDAPDAPDRPDAQPPGGYVPPNGGGPAAGGYRDHRAARAQPGLVLGLMLVLGGALLLVGRLADVTIGPDAWPLWIIVPGVAMLLASFAIPPRGGLGLAIPGAIIATVGIILWVQASYDLYATWAYAWALVAPTAPGLGTMLYGLARGDRELVGEGFRMTLVGLALFAGFALFFEGVIGLSGEPVQNMDEVMPYAVIGLGVLLVVLSFFGGERRRYRRNRRRDRVA